MTYAAISVNGHIIYQNSSLVKNRGYGQLGFPNISGGLKNCFVAIIEFQI